MTTTVPAARPEMSGAASIGGLPILAGDLLALWETLGYSYERLTTGTAPGNAARQGFAEHDHTAGGLGTLLCQPLGRWAGAADMGYDGRASTGTPFGQSHYIAAGVACATYSAQDALGYVLGVDGNEGVTAPDRAGAAPSLDWDGTALNDVNFYRSGSLWMIAGRIPAALNTAGAHHLAMRLDVALLPWVPGAAHAVSFRTLMAEVWPAEKVNHDL